MILEYRSNIRWDFIIHEVVVEILDNAFRYGDGFGNFTLTVGSPCWADPGPIKDRVRNLLFDEDGWPLLSDADGEYWECLRAPEIVVLKYTATIIDIVERLIADNTLLFNSLYYRYRIQSTEYARTVPNHIIFKITGWEKWPHNPLHQPRKT